MSFVPYPPPPPATHGPADNPGRQPTVVQTLGLLAGVILILAIVGAVAFGSSTVLIIAVAAGASGLVLGFVLHAVTRPQQRSSRSFL